MNPLHWDKLEVILSEALDLPTHARAAFLDEACGADMALRAELDSLLQGTESASVYFAALLKDAFPSVRLPRPTDDPHGLVGQHIGPYRILEKRGGGGMGVVYKAEDVRLHRAVALKFLLPTAVRDPLAKLRLTQEARAASALDHPNLCTLFDIGETEDGLLYLAMAFYEGRTIKQCLAEGPLSVSDALGLARQIAQGLASAHRHDIIHRDIKPANLILTDENVVKIVDFGLAKLDNGVDITRTGTTMGTLGYMSPEQVHGRQVDAQTDQWSLGVVLFEMLVGRRPFEGTHEPAILYQILNEPAPPVTMLCPEAPPGLARIVEKLLSKQPAQRYPTSDALLADLEGIRADAPRSASGAQTVPAPDAPSIAVLPFENMSTDPENLYFCDGLAEDLINALAQIGGLHVAARTSSFAFRHQPKEDLAAIGGKLKVKTALTGSVRKAGQRLRITARLVDTATGYLLWAERFDRIMDDIFAIQDEITLTIVEELKVELLHVEKEAIVKRPTDDLEAYQYYLKGRFHWNERTSKGLTLAIANFEKAIARDPSYAQAHTGLADCWLMLGFYGFASGQDVYPKARLAAEKAIEMDPALAEAYITRAGLLIALDRDWPGAEAALQRALTLNPGSGFAHHLYAGWILSPTGRFEEALRREKQALRIDPISPVYNAVLGYVYWWSGQVGPALAQARQTLALHPNFWLAHTALGLALESEGHYDEAITAFREAIAVSQPTPLRLGMLGHALGRAGATDEARALLQTFDERAAHDYVSPYDRALIHLGLGHHPAALDAFEQAYDEHAFWMIFLTVDQRLYTLHDEPRFLALKAKMGLA